MLFIARTNGPCTPSSRGCIQFNTASQPSPSPPHAFPQLRANQRQNPNSMGNDGGSIPKRRELVKEAAKAPTTAQIKEIRAESQEHAWNHCPLTSKPLAAPVVSDCLGTLYNKDSILEYLLADEDSTEKAEGEKVLGGRVKSLKDVVEVKFESDGDEDKSGRKEKWVCPVTRVEMGPQAKAVYVVPCGHAFTGSVVREVQERVCVQARRIYTSRCCIEGANMQGSATSRMPRTTL